MEVGSACTQLARVHSEDIIVDLAKRVLIDYKSDYIQKTEKLIYNAVRAILDEVAECQPLFKVSELLKVGGFNEETKILEPNEFDYLAVLEELSQPGAVTVELQPGRAGIARLKLNEELNINGKWDRFCSEGYVRCMQLDIESSNDAKNRKFEIFGREIIEAVFRMNSGKGRRFIKLFTEIRYSDCPREYYCNIHELQQAMIRGAEAKFPNILLEFTIAKKQVTVDLCPAVRYHNVHDCFSSEQCFSPILAEFVLNRESILLVGQADCDVRITFTETEVDYIKNKMLERHKWLYIYLKYVADIVQNTYRFELFRSYALKTVCIRHDLQCQSDSKKTSECLREVLDTLHLNMAVYRLPSVFNYNINLLQKLTPIDTAIMQGVIPYLKMIPRLSFHFVEDHDHDLDQLIKETRKVFDPTILWYFLLDGEILYSRRQ